MTLKQKQQSSPALKPLAPRLAHLAPQYSQRTNATRQYSQRPNAVPNAIGKASRDASPIRLRQPKNRTTTNRKADTGGVLSDETDGRTMVRRIAASRPG